jgi:methyl-accepting chemotaxis protein
MFNKLKLRSIGSKLIISFMAMCLIPLLILGTATYNRAKSILENKFEVTSKQTLGEINRGLNYKLESFTNSITMLSGNANFIESDIVKERIQFAEFFLKDVVESNEDVFSSYFGTEDGRFIIYPKGDMGKDFNHKERPWYKASMQNKGKIVISQPFNDARTGKLVVSVSKTVERDGKIVGVVSANISLENISKSFSQVKIGQSGYVYITDANGIILSHPKPEQIGKNTPTTLSFWPEAKANDSGFTTYVYEGQNKFATYASNKMAGWKLVAAMDETEINKDVESIGILMGIIMLAVAVVSIFVAYLLSKGMSKNAARLNSAFNKAAEGDLTTTVDIRAKDEFGSLGSNFNSMMKNISELMVQVEASSRTVLETSTSLASMAEETTASVEQVSHAIDEIAQGATQTAQSSQDGAVGINDLSQGIDKIITSTEDMVTISEETQKLSSKGLQMVEVLGEKSNKTKESAHQVSNIVQDMNASTEQINSISDSISQITEQTNLLSLNASIEAARAGEAGRGFAVVADEIRKLAEQSKKSTEEIKKIVENIKGKSYTAVTAMRETEITVNDQEQAVYETQKIFNEIISSITLLAQKIEKIKADTANIDSQKEKVVGQIENISSVSEETASSTEEVSASAQQINATMQEVTNHVEELQRLSEKLQAGVSRFVIR